MTSSLETPKISFKDIFKYSDILLVWWKSEEKKLGYIGLFLICILIVFDIYFSIKFNSFIVGFYDNLQAKNLDLFFNNIINFLIFIAVLCINHAIKYSVTKWIGFRWRSWMNKFISEKWLLTKAYYVIEINEEKSDNPDQRIAADIANICYSGIALFSQFIREISNFCSFSVILFTISKSFKFNFLGMDFNSAYFMLITALIYASISTGVILLFGLKLIKLDFSQEKLEASYRFKLMRIKERREEINQLNGEFFENTSLANNFKAITDNFYLIIKQNINIIFFRNLFVNGDQFFPLIIASPQYFSGVITFGTLMQIARIFREITDSFYIIISNMQEISGWLASLYRLGEFNNHLNEAINEKKIVTFNKTQFAISNVSIFSKKNKLIWQPADFTLNQGERKMIKGRSGLGKSSLIRVLTGSYPYYTGEIILPEAEIFVTPQRPYMPISSLSDAICYPKTCDKFSELEINQVLELCHLSHLSNHLNEVKDWQNILSIGEQQRVTFARILLHKPQWILMDEPIANLNHDLAENLINIMLSYLPQATILIISHQNLPNVKFDAILEMN